MYKCSNCGNTSTAELGKCNRCNEWGTFKKVAKKKKVETSRLFKNKKELFNYIWETRPHVSELTGKPLLPKGHMKWHWQFLHVLNILRYKKWEFNPDNILLALPSEHDHQDQYEVFKNKQEILTKEYYEKYNVKRKKK